MKDNPIILALTMVCFAWVFILGCVVFEMQGEVKEIKKILLRRT